MSDISVAAASGAAGVLSTSVMAKFFFERWVNKRETTEQDLRTEIAALHEKADQSDDTHRQELEKGKAALNEEISRLRDRSHTLSGEVQVAVTRAAVNAEIVVEIRSELRATVLRIDQAAKHISDEVGSLRNTIVKMETLLSERLPERRA